MNADSSPYDMAALGSFSRRVAKAIFAEYPGVERFARMAQWAEADGFSLDLIIPSPTGDTNRDINVWVDEQITPSLGFGPNHTHASSDEEGICDILELLGAIIADNLVIVENSERTIEGAGTWMNLQEPDAILERITEPDSALSIQLISWSGKADTIVKL